LACNSAVRQAKDEGDRPIWETRLLPMLPGLARQSAKQAADRLRDAWEQSAVDDGRGSASLLIIRRAGRNTATK
ncbi:MAG: hypothetical protein GYA33_08165, partial [Thermogutta sp.]|nr:hypothetical protein [Thermogutta sp.]